MSSNPAQSAIITTVESRLLLIFLSAIWFAPLEGSTAPKSIARVEDLSDFVPPSSGIVVNESFVFVPDPKFSIN